MARGRRNKEIRSHIATNLRARRGEIERAVVTRLENAVAISSAANADYLEGVRAAVAAAIDYGIASIEQGEDQPSPVPPVLVSQARLAACSGVSLDMVLRRCFAGYAVFEDCVLQEAEPAVASQGFSLQGLLRSQTSQFHRLLATFCDEYYSEQERWLRSSDRHRAVRVQKLLAGEFVDLSSLPYDFDCWHLAAVSKDDRAAEDLKKVATDLDMRLLLVRNGTGAVWAWWGSRDRREAAEVRGALASTNGPIALGEPGRGLSGWRTSHQEARASLRVALGHGPPIVRYAEVAVVASMLKDELLVDSLHRLFLHPLSTGRDGGKGLRETLRVYLAANWNVSSAAAALGVSRTTVTNRLRTIEELLDRPLSSCGLELEAALRLDQLRESEVSKYAPVRCAD